MQAIAEGGDIFDGAHHLAQPAIVFEAHVDRNVQMAVAIKQGAHFKRRAQAHFVFAQGERNAEQRAGRLKRRFNKARKVGRSGRNVCGDKLESGHLRRRGIGNEEFLSGRIRRPGRKR